MWYSCSPFPQLPQKFCWMWQIPPIELRKIQGSIIEKYTYETSPRNQTGKRFQETNCKTRKRSYSITKQKRFSIEKNIIKLKTCYQISKKLISETYPHLYQHIICLNLKNDSKDNSKYGNRLSEEAMPIYVILSMAGEYFTNLLHDFFRFPL